MTKSNKRLKIGNEEIDVNMEDTEIKDISDEDTVAQTNNDTRKYTFKDISFLKISVNVQKASKATATMKAKFQEVFKCLREADNTTVITHYKLDPTREKDGSITNNET